MSIRTGGHRLDKFLPLLDFQCIGYPAKVDTAVVASDFATDATCAELVGDGSVGLQFKLYAAALAAAFEVPVSFSTFT